MPVGVKTGDTVLLPEFGGQKVKLGDQELFIYRDTDFVGKMEWNLFFVFIPHHSSIHYLSISIQNIQLETNHIDESTT